MVWLQFFIALCRTLAWPAIVVLGLLAFWRPINALLAKLKHVKTPWVNIDFNEVATEKLSELNQNIPDPFMPPRPEEVSAENVKAVVDQPPKVATSVAWYKLRRKIFRLAKERGMPDGSRLNSLSNIKWLEENNIVDKVVAKALRCLKSLRDEIRNNSDNYHVAPTVADQFVETADHLGSVLDVIRNKK